MEILSHSGRSGSEHISSVVSQSNWATSPGLTGYSSLDFHCAMTTIHTESADHFKGHSAHIDHGIEHVDTDFFHEFSPSGRLEGPVGK